MLLTTLIAPYAFAKPPELADALLVGDSLAGQLGPRLAKEAGKRGLRFLYNYRAGSSTRQWVRGRWLPKVEGPHPTRLVLVSLGVNCTKAERPRLAADMRSLVSQTTVDVLWLLPPPLKMDTDYIRKAVSGPSFYPGELPLESDGIHPTDAGHKQWAALLAKELWG